MNGNILEKFKYFDFSFENPFVALLNRQWNYAVISNFLLQKCERLLPRHFSILPQDYNIFVQSRDNSLQILHPQTKKPLFNDFVERFLFFIK